MKAKKGDGKKMKAQSTAQVRATISFPPDVYETLEGIAKQKKVSLAWVVREATEQYLVSLRDRSDVCFGSLVGFIGVDASLVTTCQPRADRRSCDPPAGEMDGQSNSVTDFDVQWGRVSTTGDIF